jgi:hypothetical protein
MRRRLPLSESPQHITDAKLKDEASARVVTLSRTPT